MTAGIIADSYVIGSPPSSGFPAAALSFAPDMYLRCGDGSGTTAADSSGHGRNGTYSGVGVTLGQPSLLVGDSDPSVLMNGGRINVPYDAAWMDFDYVTFMCRVKPATGSGNMWIGGKDHQGDTSHLSWRLDTSAGKFRALGLRTSGPYMIVDGGTSIVADHEYTVGLTYDGSNLRLYVDGVPDAAPYAAAGVLLKSNVSMNFARSGTGTPYDFYGGLDEVVVKGAALSEADMLALHTAAVTAP